MGQVITFTKTEAVTELAWRALPKAERPKRTEWTGAAQATTADLKKKAETATKAKAKTKPAPKRSVVTDETPKARRKPVTHGTSELSKLAIEQERAVKNFRKAFGARNTAQALAAYKRIMKGAK